MGPNQSLIPTLLRLAKLAIPLILANLAIPLLGLADAAISGHLSSSHYLAAVTLGAQLFAIMFGSFSFLKMGTSGIVAQETGRLDPSLGLNTLFNAFIVSIIFGVMLALLGQVYIAEIIQIVEPQSDIVKPLVNYLEIRALGAPATLILFALTGWFLGRGLTKLTLYLALSMNTFNVILNYWFAIILELDSNGIAYGTVIA